MVTAAEDQARVDKWRTNLSKADSWVNGDATTDVVVDGGLTYPSIAKAMHNLESDAVISAAVAARNDAQAAAAQADAAVVASGVIGSYGNSGASYVPQGLTQASVGAITPGTGGTNGTFNLSWTGGNFSINPTGTFTVAGGVVTAVTITGSGEYFGAAPTVPTPSFAASAGLTGAAVALTIKYLVGNGQGYWVQSSDGTKINHYKNVGGVATADASVGPIYTSTAIDSTGTTIRSSGPPGYQVGNPGNFYEDIANSVRYGPKTTAGWPSTGVSITPSATVPSTRTRVDMTVAGALFPLLHWTFTRASASTDLLYTDPYTYAYGAYAANVPIMRAGKGFGTFMRAQQFLANPTAPANQTTVSNVAVGTAVLLAWGPAGSSVTVSAGTAVGTGWGTLNGNAGTFLALTITTAGTITITVTGGLTKVNLQQNPSSPTSTEPVPFIDFVGIREPDKAVGTATMISLLNSTAAYMIMRVSDVTGRSYGRSPCLWGLNNVTAGYFPSNTQYTFYDVANHSGVTTLGADTAASGATIGRTWDATSTVDFGGGNRNESQVAFQYNNGTAVTACTLGHPSSTNTAGANQLNGFIAYYEIDTAARITAEQLYEKYTSTPSPSLDLLLKGYTGTTQFPHIATTERLLAAGVVDHVCYGVAGPSHEAGVATGTNIRQVAWMTQMVADLESQGYVVSDDSVVGTNGTAYSGGTNAHDARETYTGAAPTIGGVTLGGEYINVPAGTVLTFTPPTRQTSRFHMALYTNASYGNAEVSVDGGTTPIACNENGVTSIPSTPSTFTASIADDVMTVTGAVTGPALAAGDIISGGTAISGTRITEQISGTAGGAGTYRVHIGKQTVAAATMTVIIRQRTFDAALGMKAWSTKATGANIKLAYRYARNPLLKQRIFFNGGRNGFNVTNLAQDSTPESSYLMLIRALGFACVIGGVEQTNDMAGSGTDFKTVYDYKAYAIITAIRVTADILQITDPPSATSVYNLALQDKVVNQARACFWKYSVPFYDLYGWKTIQGVQSGYDIIFPTGLYGTDTIHLAKIGHKRLKANQFGIFLKRQWAAA